MTKCKKTILTMMGDEKRQAITIPLLGIFMSLLVGAVVIFAMDVNPFDAYKSLLQGSGLLPKVKYAGGKSMLTDFTSFMNAWTPMLFAALAVSVALRGGMFNIGVSGQMLVGGFMSTLLIGYSDLSSVIAKPLVILISFISGAVIGSLIGFLKFRFRINEVVSSIMINYIAQYVISFFINLKFVDVVSRQSRAVSTESRLTLMSTPVGDLNMDIPLGIVLAFLAAFALQFIFQKTVFGYELHSVGKSPSASKYAGAQVGTTTVVAMMLSGGLAGVAGATNYLGYFNTIPPGVLPSIGFDSIAVSLLAAGNPIGVIFSSFMVTVLSKGSIYLTSSTGLVSEIASMITGIVLIFSACGMYFQHLLKKMKDSLEEGGNH